MFQPADRAAERRTTLSCEALEDRNLMATAALDPGGTLTVLGTAGDDRIRVTGDGVTLTVFDGSAPIGTFAAADVAGITVTTGAGNDVVVIAETVAQPAVIDGGEGDNKLVAGDGGSALTAGAGRDALFGGLGVDVFSGGGGANALYAVGPADVTVPGAQDLALPSGPFPTPPAAPAPQLTPEDVELLLRRAAAASASEDGIFVVVDRNGQILGARMEAGVDPNIRDNPFNLVYAVDGAYAKALTAAYFANNQGPLTSRTIQTLSESTMTEREINSIPSITDPDSTLRGPGFVANVGTKGRFPMGVPNSPQVDLFQIEHTNRDQSYAVGDDRIRGTADDVPRPIRFNLDPNFIPFSTIGRTRNPGDPVGRNDLFVPDSYGFQSGLLPTAQSRGIGTLPGGVPIFKGLQLVGGIGVFYPGKTGFATEENSTRSNTFDSSRPDRTLEAEWVAFAAVGGTVLSVDGTPPLPVGDLPGAPLPAGFGLPTGRVDLVGIQLEIFGFGGAIQGAQQLQLTAATVGRGDPNSGTNLLVAGAGTATTDDDVLFRAGQPVPDGWLVLPHDGDGITAAEVTAIVANGLQQAVKTRAAIRLPISVPAKFVYAVSDRQGKIVGLFREPDATIFSIDVAVAKARNVAYYSNPFLLQPIDQVQGLPPGTALTARTFRFLGEPRFPEGIDPTAPGPFSQLNDAPGAIDLLTARQRGPIAASAFQSVLGFDAFNPGNNFRSPFDTLNQNGIVFFPGSSPLYTLGSGPGRVLKGGFGVSGDGVDQDDVTTFEGTRGFNAPVQIRADQYLVRGVRLPYQKFNRNPEGGLFSDDA